ncbi:hypothetical protein ACJZ2D_001652 [Fusarium nematophilum]
MELSELLDSLSDVAFTTDATVGASSPESLPTSPESQGKDKSGNGSFGSCQASRRPSPEPIRIPSPSEFGRPWESPGGFPLHSPGVPDSLPHCTTLPVPSYADTSGIACPQQTRDNRPCFSCTMFDATSWDIRGNGQLSGAGQDSRPVLPVLVSSFVTYSGSGSSLTLPRPHEQPSFDLGPAESYIPGKAIRDMLDVNLPTRSAYKDEMLVDGTRLQLLFRLWEKTLVVLEHMNPRDAELEMLKHITMQLSLAGEGDEVMDAAQQEHARLKLLLRWVTVILCVLCQNHSKMLGIKDFGWTDAEMCDLIHCLALILLD